MTQEEVYEAAMTLPDESKISLAERLVTYLSTHVDPAVEKSHLEVARRRRDEIVSGRARALDGDLVMARARGIFER